MENFKERFDLTEVTDEFVNEVLPNAEELNLTANQIKVLALLSYISRIDKKDEDGYFFVENDFIRKVCAIGSKSTLNNAFGVLIESGYIDRISGSRIGKASKYCVLTCTPTRTPQVYTEKVTDNQVVTENKNATCTPNCTSNCTIDKDIDIESDSESYKNSESDIYNIFYKILYNILNKILEEKEKNSSIENNNKKEKDTLMEETLQQQINQLKEQNELLTSRLNNAAKQFKSMINTMRELQEQINELKRENKPSTTFSNEVVEGIKEQTPTVEGRKDKEQIKTINVEVKPSTAFCGDAVEAKKEVFQSPIEELNKTFNVEAIVEEFKETFTDVKEAQAKQIELIDTFKKAGLNYYNCCELQRRISKYIKSLELINSTPKEELPQEVAELKKETIPTVEVEVAQVPIQEELQELPQEAIKEAEEVIESGKEDDATEEKKTTFVGSFQEVKSNSDTSDEMLRYQDLKTKLYYSSLKEAQAAEVNPIYLYDYEVSRCVSSYQ